MKNILVLKGIIFIQNRIACNLNSKLVKYYVMFHFKRFHVSFESSNKK